MFWSWAGVFRGQRDHAARGPNRRGRAPIGPQSGAIRFRRLLAEPLENRQLFSVSLPGSMGSWAEPLSSSPDGIVAVGSIAIFSADDAIHGRELWRSDGTSSGTWMVRDLTPGTEGSKLYGLTEAGGLLYFARRTGTPGRLDLWRSDGTSSGTSPLLGRAGETIYVDPDELIEVGDELFFKGAAVEQDGDDLWGLWKSDGTSSGTVRLSGAGPSAGLTDLGQLTNVNGTVFFQGYQATTGNELWKSDGTTSGTSLVRDIGQVPPDPVDFAYPAYLQNVAGTLFFRVNWVLADTPGPEHVSSLWKSDGTSSGTVLVATGFGGLDRFYPGPDYAKVAAVNGALYFVADDKVHGPELWTSDGTSSGTRLVRDLDPYGQFSLAHGLTNVGGALFFLARDQNEGGRLWRSDGTSAGTNPVPSAENVGFSFRESPVSLNEAAYGQGGGTVGSGLVRADATGISLIRGFSLSKSVASVASLANVNGTLYFSANDGLAGYELWRSDGTSSGTWLVRDIAIDNAPRQLLNRVVSSTVAVGNWLFFTAESASQGWELWRSDGTVPGTQLVRDIFPGEASSYPSELTNVNGILYFRALDFAGGYELWRSDGTSLGTYRVRDVVEGPVGIDPRQFVNVAGRLFFTANDGILGTELWSSDGTSSGTKLVRDIWVDNPHYLSGSIPAELTEAGGVLYFTALAHGSGRELWRSDGTSNGTYLVADISSGVVNSDPQELTNVGGTLFFQARTEELGVELWKSDGTSSGTVLVRDIDPNRDSSNPHALVNAGGILLFSANNGPSGIELWRSDGTRAGTRNVIDIWPGPSSGSPGQVFPFGESYYFFAQDPQSGTRLWRTNGTSSGTQLVEGRAPWGWVDPQSAVCAANQIYLRPQDGSGLWVYAPVAARAGDADGNGEVDRADYSAWAASFGQSGSNLRADWNADGAVGAADYALWAAQANSASEVTATATPERATPQEASPPPPKIAPATVAPSAGHKFDRAWATAKGPSASATDRKPTG